MFGFLINIVVGLVLSFASTLLQQAFAPKPQEQQQRTGTRGSAQIGGRVPQYFLVGTVGEAGKLEYRNAWGESNGVPNAYLTDVHSFGDLPISALSGLYINGVRQTIAETGAVAQGYPVTLEGDGGTRHFWWKFFNGTQSVADSYLVSKFGGDADRAWTSDMVGIGVPYLITTSLWNESLWTTFPTVLGEFQGIKLYDPRFDSTAGGSGSQRWDTPSTWAFSDNNMVIIYNIERGIYYNGAHVWGGKKTAAEMPYAAWAAAMNACDLAINLVGGGTERQFRAGRRINLNERPGEVIRELLIGCNGRITHCADGTVYPLVGVPAEADGAFTDADVLATNALGTIPFPNLDEVINGATATYREPLQAWEDKETAPYLRSDLEAQDDGRQQIEGLDLGTTFSGTQAQRVIKAVIEEGRRFRTHVVALPPEYAQFRPLQLLAWTSDRFDYSAKLFLITARTVEPFGNVILGLQEIDPTDHDWDPEADEQPLSFAPVVTNRPAPQEVSGPSVAPVPGTLAYDVFWSAPSVAVDVQFVRVSHRLPDDDDARFTVLIPKPDLLTGSARVPVGLDLSNTLIEVQIEYIPYSGRPTIASAWMPVTIANVRIGPDDLTPELNEQRALATRTIEQMQADRSRAIAQMANALGDRMVDLHTIRTEVSARFETTEARYFEEITVVASDLGALADRTEGLEAEVNDPITGLGATASGLNSLRVQVTNDLVAQGELIQALEVKSSNATAGFLLAARVVAGPAGADGAVQLGLRQTVNGAATWAGIMIVLKDGVGKIYLDANETIVTGTLRDVTGKAYWNMNTGDIVSTGFWSFG